MTRLGVLAALMGILLVTIGVLSPRVATAATYYVATTGSDSHPGSQAQPFQTLNKGVSMLRAGDTLYLRGGTYRPGNIGQYGTGVLPSGTSWSHAVTIAGYPGETVTLTGSQTILSLTGGESYVIFDRLVIDASASGAALFMCCGTHHIRFQDGEITNGGREGSLVFGDAPYLEVLRSKIHHTDTYAFYYFGHHALFEGNEISHISSYAFHIYNSGQSNVSHNIVRNNILHDIGFYDPRGYLGCAILLASGGNNMACNNRIYNNGCGIQVDYTNGATNNQVYNNIVYHNRDAGISIGAKALETIVQYNLVYGNGTDIVNWGDPGAVIANNLTDSTATAPPQAASCERDDEPPPMVKLPAPRHLRILLRP